MKSADRLILETQVENDILRLEPDFDTAVEIIAALHASLKSRYPDYMLYEIDHYCDYLCKALERAPIFAEPEVDECAAYKDSLLAQ